MDRARGNQGNGQDCERDGQNDFHYLASLRTGSVSAMAGNSSVEERRRRSESINTRSTARMLLPIGNVPQSRPSVAVGRVPTWVSWAGTMPSLAHKLMFPWSYTSSLRHPAKASNGS